jgi:ubiquinol-cytochrome c reductase cytochrome c1 subunit
MKRIVAAALAALCLAGASAPAFAAGEVTKPRPVNGSWEGPFGRFDMAQVQRGFQVYKEVCSSCHGMGLMHYRNLGERGGPYFDEKFPNANDNPQVRAIAQSYTIKDVDAEGNEIERPGRPADRFVYPFESEAQGRAANGGAYPPDLSVIVHARHGGADYIYSLLTGYNKEPPADKVIAPGKHYNPYFAGGQIAMGPQLFDDRVTYQTTAENEGVKATEDQIARDVTAFLAWAAEPKQQIRKELGLQVMIYLTILAILVYWSYRRIWRNVEH